MSEAKRFLKYGKQNKEHSDYVFCLSSTNFETHKNMQNYGTKSQPEPVGRNCWSSKLVLDLRFTKLASLTN